MILFISLVGFASITVGLVCESYNFNCNVTNASSNISSVCSSLRHCDQAPRGVQPACFASFGRDNQGKLQVITKGCMFQKNAKCIRSSVCKGRQRIRTRNRQYCCCFSNFCNRDVIVFVEERRTERGAKLKVPANSPYVSTGATPLITCCAILTTVLSWRYVSN